MHWAPRFYLRTSKAGLNVNVDSGDPDQPPHRRNLIKEECIFDWGIMASCCWNYWWKCESLGTLGRFSSMYTAEILEPAHDKKYNKSCVTSEDSDQPVHPPRMARALVYPSSDNLQAVEGTCDLRRLWSDCADTQADLSLRWSHKSYCSRYYFISFRIILPLVVYLKMEFCQRIH